MAVLDTDFLIAYLREKYKSYEVLQQLKNDQVNLKTTVFNVAELYKGCYNMKNVAKGLRSVKNLIESLNEILTFNKKSIEEYAKISADLKNRGELIGTMDELIASVCVAHKETFYTRNKTHFEKIEDLSIVNWYELGQKLKEEE
jgi:predicted nucleic acid-binding protein